jgi:hypothetical protein
MTAANPSSSSEVERLRDEIADVAAPIVAVDHRRLATGFKVIVGDLKKCNAPFCEIPGRVLTLEKNHTGRMFWQG